MLELTVNTYRAFGGDVYLVRLREPVEQVMRDSGFLDFIGLDHILPQEGAIEYLFEDVLDPAVCTYECELRVFAECQALKKHPYREQVPPISRVALDPTHIVGVEDFWAMADDPSALVLDVREPDEFARGHIPGATLMPLRTVLDKGPDLPRDRRLLLACRSGRRTQRALHMLVTMGFTDVYGLRGGILAWRAEGFPVAMEEDPVSGTGAGAAS
jgi:SulP family sulfate permease